VREVGWVEGGITMVDGEIGVVGEVWVGVEEGGGEGGDGVGHERGNDWAVGHRG
jgi:hypothetical protein